MSGYGKVDTNDDSGGGELSSNKCCELIGDLIYGVSPEKKRGRNFYRKMWKRASFCVLCVRCVVAFLI